MNYTYDDWLPLVTVQVEVVHFCQVGIMRFINADPIGFVGGSVGGHVVMFIIAHLLSFGSGKGSNV